MTAIEQRAAEQFRRDTAKHELTVLHDDGLHRHLRVAEPGSGHLWFELVTWPGGLTIRGDMGCYIFSCAKDMFDFFRRSAWGGGPNLHYWAQKADAGDIHAGVREYSADLLRKHIEDDLAALAEDDLAERLRVRAEKLGTTSDRLPAGAAAGCRAASAAYMAGLREELDDDLLGELPMWCIDDEGDALAGVRQFDYRPDGEPPFTFDADEWKVRDWSGPYVWCCHAILFGIGAYDRVKAEQPVPALSAAATADAEALAHV
ncbi:hypothetical protein [Kitasatospora purpeofusca]|uniref:hypothetical protein n=1 Tax=Kitasatospora purpeofusca TaxID=67352 RepID=UPI00367A5546